MPNRGIIILRSVSLSLAVAITALTVGIGQNAANAGEPIRCTCYFQQTSGYTAIGTRAACSTMTRKNLKGPGEHCEVSFGGTGYDERLLNSSNVKTVNYRQMAFSVTQINLEAALTGRPELVSDPAYLRLAIPAYMRAVYLRPGAELDDKARDDLDKQVNDFTTEYAGQIADVFLGKRAPFQATWRENHSLTVDRGAVRFVYASQVDLVAVFFDSQASR